MAQKPYVYRSLPAYRYKKDCRPVIVYTQDEEDKLLGEGWRKTPKEQVIEDLPESLKGQAEGIGKVIDKSTGLINMILKVPKCRRKKDLYVVGDLLGLELDTNGYSLKKLKDVILEEAAKHGYLEDYLEAQEKSENEHSTASH